jgi:DNA-binding NarL/FixJ family response regulator
MSNQEIGTIRVLLVDDHPFILAGIRSCLTPHERFAIVGEAANGKEAIEKAREQCPHVIIMDISMPVMGGLEATQHLRQTMPDAKVLMLTMYEERELISQIVESGAQGYVSKGSCPLELVRAIEAVHQGQAFFSAPLTEKFPNNQMEGDKTSALKHFELSLREREVLTLIAEGFSNKEAASRLGVSVRTVEKHRERIMTKLDLHSIVELTKFAIANRMVQVN